MKLAVLFSFLALFAVSAPQLACAQDQDEATEQSDAAGAQGQDSEEEGSEEEGSEEEGSEEE